MISSQLRSLLLGVAVAVGLGGGAEARSSVGGRHGASVFDGAARHGSAFSFSVAHRGGDHAGGFGGRHSGHSRGFSYAGGYGQGVRGYGGGGLQCVTFARADSGIELSGNASAWWYNAAGLYQRGARPEAGSVLNFRANGAMRMGHVAVVNQIVNSRTIDIDHANWGGPGARRGGISRDISVVDVSPNNDWSAVRVALGHSGEYGSIYPTYGFIYNRPDRGMMVAANDTTAPVPALNPAPRDLRGVAREVAYDEVAEAPDVGEVAPSVRHSRFGHAHRHLAAMSYFPPSYRLAAYSASTVHHHHRLHGRW